MIIYWLLFLLIAAAAIYNWKKTVIAWIPFSMLFNDGVRLKYDKPAITLELAVDVVLLLLFLINILKDNKHKDKYIFKPVFIAYLVSYGLSMVHLVVPFGEVINGTIKSFITGFVIVYLFQMALRTVSDVKFFFKCLKISLILILLLAIFEAIFKTNPILNYIYYSAPDPSLIANRIYYNPHGVSRFGMIRCYSFFGIHIDFGCACVMWMFFLLYVHKKVRLLKDQHVVAMILLCIVGAFLSNSKTPIVGIIIMLLSVFNVSTLSNLKLVLPIFIGLVCIIIFLPNFMNNFWALFDESVAESGGGSNLEMRTIQYELGLELFKMNPIFGNGVGSVSYYVGVKGFSQLLGAESSLLKILPDRGLVGLAVYLLMYLYTFIRLHKVIGIQMAGCFVASIVAMELATGFMTFSIWASIVIVILRMNKLKSLRQTIRNKLKCKV